MHQGEDVLGIHVRFLHMTFSSCLFNLGVKDPLSLIIGHVEGMLDNIVTELVLQELHHRNILRTLRCSDRDGANPLKDGLSVVFRCGF